MDNKGVVANLKAQYGGKNKHKQLNHHSIFRYDKLYIIYSWYNVGKSAKPKPQVNVYRMLCLKSGLYEPSGKYKFFQAEFGDVCNIKAEMCLN
jgi:hypothetical protein